MSAAGTGMPPSTDQRILDRMREGRFRHYWTVWDLAIDLKLSRPTVRKAMNRLAEAGLLQRAVVNVVSEDRKWGLTEKGKAP